MLNYSDLALSASDSLLTLPEFIHAVNYPIDRLFVDKFWNTMEEDRLIYVDDKLIRWMGYEGTSFHAKNSFKKLLSSIDENYYEYNNEEYANYVNHLVSLRGDTRCYPSFDVTHGSGRTTHLMLSPECLKIVMMELNTHKGHHVRSYYVSLERLFKVYSRYQSSFRQQENDRRLESKELIIQQNALIIQQKDSTIQNHIARAGRLEVQNKRLIQYKLINERNESIYIVSTVKYARKGWYKVGRTKNLISRVSSHNTSHTVGDEVLIFAEYKVHDSVTSERRISTILNGFRPLEDKEFYLAKYRDLLYMIDFIICHERMEETESNKFVRAYLAGEADGTLNYAIDESDLSEVIHTNAKRLRKNKTIKGPQPIANPNTDEDTEQIPIPNTTDSPQPSANEDTNEQSQPNTDEVVKYIRSLNLTRDQAIEVLVAILQSTNGDTIKQKVLSDKLRERYKRKCKVSEWISLFEEAANHVGKTIVRR